MGTLSVVMASPALNDDPRFLERIEDFTIEQFIAQTRVEALDEAILPRAAGRNVSRLRADGIDPVLDRSGDELGSLSERTYSGTPRRMNKSDSTSITAVELSLRSMRMARHSCVNSSMMFSMRYFLPSGVRYSMKS
jgi:hypothetical protein